MASLETLDNEHLQSLGRALINCLSTSVAEYTYAQILDGQPTCYKYAGDHYAEDSWPVMQHEEICPGYLEKARTFRSDFDVLSLKFDAKVIQAYQGTLPNSVAWKLRLLELVVSACHNIAIFLYQMDDGAHKHAEHKIWLAEQLKRYPSKRSQARMLLPPATLFWHGSFRDSHRYPHGIAELAGYWAETQIFGGVLLFDRGDTGEECNGVYLHNIRRNSTLAPPTEQQFSQLMAFLLSPAPDHEHCPLPIKVTPENRWRWDAHDAMTKYNIFRNRHEIPRRSRGRPRCVISEHSWPDYTEACKRADEAAKQAAGEQYDKAFMAESEGRRLHVTPTSMLWDRLKDEIAEQEPDKKKQGRPPYFFDS